MKPQEPRPAPPPTKPSAVLSHWIGDLHGATARPIAGGSFSGACIWQVDYRGQSFALRQWQPNQTSDRVIVIHLLQRWVAREGLPVPVPLGASATGQTFVHEGNALWELAPWMPGVADYHADPKPEKLEAAMRSLASLHLSIARMPIPIPSWVATTGVSPALMRRSERLCNLVLSDLRKLQNAVRRQPPSPGRAMVQEALQLVERTAETELKKSQRWETEPFQLQMCVRDVWHDHILFTESRVTGIIDFGALGLDSPAGDVARLLGSLVGDDRDRWRLGLEAYESVKPFSASERDAIPFFDSSGVVLSTVNWVHWLFRDPSSLPATIDYSAVRKRMERLVVRLRILAANGA